MGSSRTPQDVTRQERKAKKRKLEDAVPDLPGDVDNTAEVEVAEKAGKKRKRDVEKDVIDNKERKQKKKKKKENKRREKEDEAEVGGEAIEAEVVNEDTEEKVGKKEKKKSKKDDKSKDCKAMKADVEIEAVAEDAGPKKSKKERKAERRAKEAAEAAAAGKSTGVTPVEDFKSKKSKAEGNVNGKPPMNSENGEAEKKSKTNNRNREKKRKGAATTTAEGAVNREEKLAEGKEEKVARFICFIGNLPFSATTASITKHFAAVKPISVRALTQKDDPKKSRGIAFIEFEGYDHMKTCLKMFHHSIFDDGVSAPRRINVELTAGGGGNTKERRGKIEEKNQKLNEQRVRRMQEEEKAKLEKSGNAAAIDESAIHPSRRARVPGM